MRIVFISVRIFTKWYYVLKIVNFKGVFMKKIIIIAMTLAFVASAATGVMASRINCTVDSVEGYVVTMTCKSVDNLEVGTDVRLRVTAPKAIEGC